MFNDETSSESEEINATTNCCSEILICGKESI
jgi:hypothetical protein